ncbi:glyco_like_mftF, transferase 2, rSAM/selenodomain-associated [Burkholderiaceae bacterium]
MSNISVIIPAHNAAKFLFQAIESVLAQRDVAVEEIWVIDDGSDDDTAAIASRYGSVVHCHSQPRSGAAAARNVGASLARTQWIAFLDADDVWLPKKLSEQWALLAQVPNGLACVGQWENFLCQSLDSQMVKRLRFPPGVQSVPMATTLLISKECFNETGGFDESLMFGEFVDWLFRARSQGVEFHCVPSLVAKRRVHGANHSIDREVRAQSLLRLAIKRVRVHALRDELAKGL